MCPLLWTILLCEDFYVWKIHVACEVVIDCKRIFFTAWRFRQFAVSNIQIYYYYKMQTHPICLIFLYIIKNERYILSLNSNSVLLCGDFKNWSKTIQCLIVILIFDYLFCTGTRLRNIVVRVDRKVCASYRRRARPGQQLTLKCKRPLKGRRVEVQMHAREYLSLAEVEVKAVPGIFIVSCGKPPGVP